MNEKLFYRRVWQWNGSSWDTVKQGYVKAYSVDCAAPGMFDFPTFCSVSPPSPPIFERWWRWSPGTYGTGGDWIWATEEKNWV